MQQSEREKWRVFLISVTPCYPISRQHPKQGTLAYQNGIFPLVVVCGCGFAWEEQQDFIMLMAGLRHAATDGSGITTLLLPCWKRVPRTGSMCPTPQLVVKTVIWPDSDQSTALLLTSPLLHPYHVDFPPGIYYICGQWIQLGCQAHDKEYAHGFSSRHGHCLVISRLAAAKEYGAVWTLLSLQWDVTRCQLGEYNASVAFRHLCHSDCNDVQSQVRRLPCTICTTATRGCWRVLLHALCTFVSHSVRPVRAVRPQVLLARRPG